MMMASCRRLRPLEDCLPIQESEQCMSERTRADLQEVAKLLRDSDHLGPEAQEALVELVDELVGALASGRPAPAEAEHLADLTVHLLDALHQRHDRTMLTAARTRLEEALNRAEARAPIAVNLAWRLLDALAGIGI